jgi:hypothetical protein
MIDADTLRAAGTSKTAIERHYDLSDEFFQTWLVPSLCAFPRVPTCVALIGNDWVSACLIGESVADRGRCCQRVAVVSGV